MSTVYNLVADAGGSLDASSTPGQGTTIVVDIPIVDEGAQTTGPVRQRDASTADKTDNKEQPQILVVDDNSQIALYVAHVLRQNGFRVSGVGDGRKALAFLANQTPDLILTDVIMPEMSGPMMVKELQEQGSEIPVIFMSGHTDDRISAAGLDSSRFSLLRKPFAAAALVKQVSLALNVAAR